MSKIKLYYWYGVDHAINTAFIRIREEDKDDETLTVLNRLLGRHGMDVDELYKNQWKRYEAVPLPRWMIPKLDPYYDMVELEEDEYLDPKGVR